MSNRVEDLQEEIEILSGYKIAYKRAMRENQRYKEALSFYADESNHTEHRGTRIFGDVFYDKGEKARQALEADTQ
jgi:hypothetical protein